MAFSESPIDSAQVQVDSVVQVKTLPTNPPATDDNTKTFQKRTPKLTRGSRALLIRRIALAVVNIRAKFEDWKCDPELQMT